MEEVGRGEFTLRWIEVSLTALTIKALAAVRQSPLGQRPEAGCQKPEAGCRKPEAGGLKPKGHKSEAGG